MAEQLFKINNNSSKLSGLRINLFWLIIINQDLLTNIILSLAFLLIYVIRINVGFPIVKIVFLIKKKKNWKSTHMFLSK